MHRAGASVSLVVGTVITVVPPASVFVKYITADLVCASVNVIFPPRQSIIVTCLHILSKYVNVSLAIKLVPLERIILSTEPAVAGKVAVDQLGVVDAPERNICPAVAVPANIAIADPVE